MSVEGTEMAPQHDDSVVMSMRVHSLSVQKRKFLSLARYPTSPQRATELNMWPWYSAFAVVSPQLVPPFGVPFQIPFWNTGFHPQI